MLVIAIGIIFIFLMGVDVQLGYFLGASAIALTSMHFSLFVKLALDASNQYCSFGEKTF